MISGNNKITLNEATMQRIIEQWIAKITVCGTKIQCTHVKFLASEGVFECRIEPAVTPGEKP